MEQIYEIEPLLKAGACIQIHPQGYSMYPFIDPRRDEVVLAGRWRKSGSAGGI